MKTGIKINKTNNIKQFVYLTLGIILIMLLTPQNIMAASKQYKSVGLFVPTSLAGSGAITITVTFDANGGKVTTKSTSVNFKSTYGKLPEATRENYEFKGWYTSASGGIKKTEKSMASKPFSHTLYAHWKGSKCDITLDANGGNLSKKTIAAYYGCRYRLPIPTKENFIFDGWFTALDGEEKVNSNTIFDKNSEKKLYAHWTEKKLKIAFIAFNDEEIYYQEVICGKVYGELPKPEKEGYIFGDWYTLEEYKKNDGKPISAQDLVTETTHVKVFARWYITQ
jgi:uncharacterized repeat protein (TIGR02543 family)